MKTLKKIFFVIAMFMLINPVIASLVGLGAAGDFAVLGLEGGTVSVNSASTVIGDFGYGKNVTSTTNQKIGENSDWTGGAYVHSTTTFNYTAKDYIPSDGIHIGTYDSLLEQANSDAIAASNAYSALSTDVSLGILGDNDNRTVTAVGNVTVVSITSLNYNSDTLTFTGVTGYDNIFIINVAGDFAFSQSSINLVNTSADKILFNFPNASSIDINKSATVWNGTILAPLGSIIYHNPAIYNGAIIAKDISLHSDFNLTNVPFIPEPATISLFAFAGLLIRRKN